MQNGDLIFEMRLKYGMTQREVAHHLRIALTVYKLYESGIRPMKIDELNRMSNLIHISLNALLGISENLDFCGNEEIDYKYLKFSLRYIRRINRISQKELAKELKVSVPTVAKLEKHPEDATASYLKAFAEYFDISVDYICGKTMKKEVL